MISSNFKNDAQKTYVIFGASESGEKCLQLLKESGIHKIYFSDNRQALWNVDIQGIKVLGLDQLYIMDKLKTVIIIASSAFADIKEQLSYAGFIEIYGYMKKIDIDLKNQIIQGSKGELRVMLLRCLEAVWYRKAKSSENLLIYLNNSDKLQRVYELLEDEASKKCLINVIEYRFTNKRELLEEIYVPVQYFIDSFSFHNQEVFVDGGACQGDSVFQFKQYTGNQFKRIYCFEANPAFALGMKYLFAQDERIRIIDKGLYSEAKSLEFSVKSHGSALQEGGSEIVETVSIDESIHEPVTFIKMDIEGSELNALEGAVTTITRDKPRMAICVYHKPEDFWTIPFYIKNLVPEYKLYMKHHYLEDSWETVVYAMI